MLVSAAVGISDQLTQNLRRVPSTMMAQSSVGDQLVDQSSAVVAAVDITTNVSLALSTCAATGDLLQPSYPLTVCMLMIVVHYSLPTAVG